MQYRVGAAGLAGATEREVLCPQRWAARAEGLCPCSMAMLFSMVCGAESRRYYFCVDLG